MKREFGFRGYIMSDWGAQHSTMSAAVGLDVSYRFKFHSTRRQWQLIC